MSDRSSVRRHLRIKLPGSSMRRQGTFVFFLVVQWYAYSSFWKITTCISSYTHLITPATKYKNVFWYSGKIRFIEPQGINGHRRAVERTHDRTSQKQYVYPLSDISKMEAMSIDIYIHDVTSRLYRTLNHTYIHACRLSLYRVWYIHTWR